MKEKLIDSLGFVGEIIYYILSMLVSVMPFIMIGSSFFVTLVLILISQFVPFATPIFWIWGLFCAFSGKQDFWAFCYYILFAIMFFPLAMSLIGELSKRKNKEKSSYKKKLSGDNEAIRKADLFRETIRNEIIALQSHLYPSCEELIMHEVEKAINENSGEFEEWGSDVNYFKVSLTNLYNITFDMLASGKYHVYTGMLNATGSQLHIICTGCLSKAHENNYITEEELEDQLNALSESIQFVG